MRSPSRLLVQMTACAECETKRAATTRQRIGRRLKWCAWLLGLFASEQPRHFDQSRYHLNDRSDKTKEVRHPLTPFSLPYLLSYTRSKNAEAVAAASIAI